MKMMTTAELAARTGVTQQMVRYRLLAHGLKPEYTSGIRGGKELTWTPCAAILAITKPTKARKVPGNGRWGNSVWADADRKRQRCEKHDVMCIMDEVVKPCSECWREMGHEMVSGIVCDTFEEIAARYKEASR